MRLVYFMGGLYNVMAVRTGLLLLIAFSIYLLWVIERGATNDNTK